MNRAASRHKGGKRGRPPGRVNTENHGVAFYLAISIFPPRPEGKVAARSIVRGNANTRKGMDMEEWREKGNKGKDGHLDRGKDGETDAEKGGEGDK